MGWKIFEKQILELICYISVTGAFMNQKLNRRIIRYSIIIGVCGALSFIIGENEDDIINIIVWMLFQMSSLFFLTNAPVLTRLKNAICCYFTVGFGYIFIKCMILLIVGRDIGETVISYAVLLTVIFFIRIGLEMMKKRFNIKDIVFTKRTNILIVVSVFFVALVLELGKVQFENSKEILLFVCALILATVFTILIIVLIYYENVVQMKNKKIILKEEYIDLQKEYYDNLSKNNYDMRKFRHDTSHHFQSIQFFLQEGQVAEAEEYLEHMGYQFGEIRNQIYHCGNYVIDVVLNQFIPIMKKYEIDFNFNNRLENNEIRIKDVDLSSILHNLLQNAVEASNLLEQSRRKIELSVTKRKSFFTIVISNNVGVDFTIENIKLQQTTKNDKKNHGMGLKNVQTIVEQYHGTMRFEKGQDNLSIKILLIEE